MSAVPEVKSSAEQRLDAQPLQARPVAFVPPCFLGCRGCRLLRQHHSSQHKAFGKARSLLAEGRGEERPQSSFLRAGSCEGFVRLECLSHAFPVYGFPSSEKDGADVR